MDTKKKEEYKSLIENVLDWAKKCLEVLKFQSAWRKGQVPETERAGRIRTTEEEKKLVEEIFNPASTFPTRTKPGSGFDIGSIKIEVFGPKASAPPAKQKPGVAASASESASQEEEPKAADSFTQKSLLPADSNPAPLPSPQPVPTEPKRVEPAQEPPLPPAPVNEDPEPVASVEPNPVVDSEPDRPKLLVIDDYEPLLNMLSRSLKAAGYEPICARDGVEGIVKLHEQAVDLIITDVQMPKLDGFDLSKMLNVRQETRDIPVIFLTEVLDAQTSTVAKRLGAADTIIKPFTMDTLLESVKTVLAIHQAIEASPKPSTETKPEPVSIY